MAAASATLEAFTHPQPVLLHDDARLLAVYFGHMRARRWRGPFEPFGATGVDRSSYGVFLDMMQGTGGSKSCPECDGHGWVASRKYAKRRKEGLSDSQRDLLALIEVYETRVSMPAFDRMCLKCKGLGVVERETKHRARGRVTARSTGSSVKQFRPYSSLHLGEWLYDVSRAYRKVAALVSADPWAVHVLDCFFEEAGNGWKKCLEARDLTALWHLTPAGRTLLRQAGAGVMPAKFWQNLKHEQREKRSAKLERQFAACQEQAGGLWDKTVGAWVELHG